jgi:chorismate--pyruvate lyase
LLLADCPLSTRQWLFDRGSLTQRLIHKSHGEFSVQLLQQQWGRPRLDEASALGISPQQQTLIREVILHGNGQPWVYARSVLPLQALNGPLRFLRKLDNRPLGQLLFNNPAIYRGPISVTLWPEHLLPARFEPSPFSPNWARRSVFHYGKTGILVTELFLPPVMQ